MFHAWSRWMTKPEYDAVYAKLLALITEDEGNEVPVMFRSMIPKEAAPHLADQCTKVAIAALDAFRAKPSV